jgi:NAD(P)-dependent dehydrogenase (short-subunit alcohol dehydrogenase family)
MIAIRGMGSNIAKTFIDVVFRSGTPFEIKRNTVPPYNADQYLICQGILYGKRRVDMTNDEISETYKVNYIQPACICDEILEHNPTARICVVGSESGVSGSYDECYADSKRLLHHYVETKRTEPAQQLVCVAPSIIEDAAMTLRRKDTENLSKLRSQHPKGRFLTSLEVAKMIYFLLFEDLGYTTGVVIRMHGGKYVS